MHRDEKGRPTVSSSDTMSQSGWEMASDNVRLSLIAKPKGQGALNLVGLGMPLLV